MTGRAVYQPRPDGWYWEVEHEELGPEVARYHGPFRTRDEAEVAGPRIEETLRALFRNVLAR